MIEAVLFDLDGTLIRFSASYADFMREIAARWGITDREDPFFGHYARAITSEGAVTFQSSIEAALTESGRAIPSDIFEHCEAAVEGYANGIELLPRAMDVLASFDGLPKAIVSNGPSDMQRAAISITNLGSYFDRILISGDADVAVRKPNPEIFLLACRRLGVRPDCALMIGDNVEADVEGARSAGLNALHINEVTTGG
jgi:putative hydrolase of the HAD superfamily